MTLYPAKSYVFIIHLAKYKYLYPAKSYIFIVHLAKYKLVREWQILLEE